MKKRMNQVRKKKTVFILNLLYSSSNCTCLEYLNISDSREITEVAEKRTFNPTNPKAIGNYFGNGLFTKQNEELGHSRTPTDTMDSFGRLNKDKTNFDERTSQASLETSVEASRETSREPSRKSSTDGPMSEEEYRR